MPGRLHLRGRAHALYPPRRVRGLRCLRAGLPGRGHLLRGRRSRAVEGLLQGQRRLLRRSRLARRRIEDREDWQGPPHRRGPPAAGDRALIPPRLPGFPWDRLSPAAATARAHPDGIVDLSVGSPVDPVPPQVRDALGAASNSPGYPLTKGTGELRAAAAGWL